MNEGGVGEIGGHSSLSAVARGEGEGYVLTLWKLELNSVSKKGVEYF
jgi:hypothetical protein